MTTLALKPTDVNGIFETKISGMPVILAFKRRNREGIKKVDNSVTFSIRNISDLKKLAAQLSLPAFVGVLITSAGKYHSAVAIPLELFQKTKGGSPPRADFMLSQKFREQYKADKDSISDFRVEELEREKPAPAPDKPEAEKA